MAAAMEAPCMPAPIRREGREVPRGSTPRMQRLAVEVAGAIGGRFVEEAELGAAFTPPAGVSPYLAEAQRFADVYPRLTPVIREDEPLVGARVRSPHEPGWQWYPDGNVGYVEGFARNAPPDRPDIREMALRGLLSPQGSLNHKVVDYAGFVRTGSAALAARARARAETKSGEEREFCLAFALGHEAMVAHARTYAEACRRLAETAGPARAAELLEMARICDKVPAGPAETFHEALQSLWFAYMVAGDGTGRVDVYLNDFYQADRTAGRITPAQAQELIECFLIKFHGDTVQGDCNVSSVQTMTLGGLLPDGSDATNDLTRLILRAVRSVRMLRPTVYVRCHERTPADVLDLAVEMLGEGLAEPSFYGDRPIIEGLTRLGVPLEQARDYALSGCTEVVSPGRGNWGAPNGWINLALLAEEALRECAGRGVADEAGLWEVLARRVDELAEMCRVCNCWVDEQVGTRYTQTLLMPVALERCKDIARGGAETHYGHWEAMGLPNAADMLHAAGRLAFDEGVPLAGLLARLDAGDPELLARLKRMPRFGNGNAEVDGIAARLVTLMADALERRSTPLRKALVLGHLAGGENMHIAYGALMGATLDGRRAGQTLADSLAGSQGQCAAGPTALVHSLCALDHSRLVAGNVSTLQLGPHELATPESRAKVVALIRSFVAMGGSQLQINVMDPQTLRRAQENPEEHRGLMVRVAGYSADFTRIGRTLQDEIIARVEGLGKGVGVKSEK